MISNTLLSLPLKFDLNMNLQMWAFLSFLRCKLYILRPVQPSNIDQQLEIKQSFWIKFLESTELTPFWTYLWPTLQSKSVLWSKSMTKARRTTFLCDYGGNLFQFLTFWLFGNNFFWWFVCQQTIRLNMSTIITLIKPLLYLKYILCLDSDTSIMVEIKIFSRFYNIW